MSEINNTYQFPSKKNLSTTFLKTHYKSFTYNNLNNFSSRDLSTSIKDSKRIISPDYQYFQTNIDIFSPLTTSRNTLYSTNRVIPSRINNDYPLNNITKSLILNRLSKKNKNHNSHLRLYTNDNNKTDNIYKINNRYLVENLQLNNNIKDKNYTNLLITKVETNYPLSTYYLSPKQSHNCSTSNLFSYNKIYDYNYKRNSPDLNNSQNFCFSPLGNKTIAYRCESEKNIFCSRPNNYNNYNLSNTYRTNTKYDMNTNELKNKHFKKYKTHQKLKKNLLNFEIFCNMKNNIKQIKNFSNIIKNVIMKKILKFKKKFFIKLFIINCNSHRNYNYFNKCNTHNSLYNKQIKINKNFQEDKNFLSDIKTIFKNKTNILNKKKKKEIYVPKKSLKNNKKLKNINVNTYKNYTLKFHNNYTATNKNNTLLNINFNQNSSYNIFNRKINESNILSLNTINNSSLKDNKFSEKKINNNNIIYSKNITNITNENSFSFGKIYQKKISKNLTNKKCSYKFRILSNIINIQINNSYKKKNNKLLVPKDKNTFMINNGMLIDHIISNDEKLYINVKYVILINKGKNNIHKSSFIQSDFKINKVNDLYIVKKILSIDFIKNKNINKSSDKKEKIFYYKSDIKYFFNFLKIKSFYMAIKKYMFLNLMKKIKKYENKYKIINYDSPRNNENVKLIRVKRLQNLKKINYSPAAHINKKSKKFKKKQNK